MEENQTGKEGNVTVSVTSGAWPIGLFKRWESDCIKNFGNCRWMKMWHDHIASQELEVFVSLFGEIDALKKRIELIEKKPEQEQRVTLV